MLRSTSTDIPVDDRNISIITNFDCRSNCWYCIWKGHELQYANEPTDWDKLRKFLIDNQHKFKPETIENYSLFLVSITIFLLLKYLPTERPNTLCLMEGPPSRLLRLAGLWVNWAKMRKPLAVS